jgi:hypothetical protein
MVVILKSTRNACDLYQQPRGDPKESSESRAIRKSSDQILSFLSADYPVGIELDLSAHTVLYGYAPRLYTVR